MLLVPSLALAAMQAAAPMAVQPETSQPNSQQLVCKTIAKTNTRVGKRTCRTRAEWEQVAEQSRRGAEEWINRPGFDERRSD